MSQCQSFDAKKPLAEPDITEKPIIDRRSEAWMRALVINNLAIKKPTIVDVGNVQTKSTQAITSISAVMLQGKICQAIAV